jgi:hypothetical protein
LGGRRAFVLVATSGAPGTWFGRVLLHQCPLESPDLHAISDYENIVDCESPVGSSAKVHGLQHPGDLDSEAEASSHVERTFSK